MEPSSQPLSAQPGLLPQNQEAFLFPVEAAIGLMVGAPTKSRGSFITLLIGGSGVL